MRVSGANSYDALSNEYAARIFHELEHKPLDREWLSRLVAAVRTVAPSAMWAAGQGMWRATCTSKARKCWGGSVAAHDCTGTPAQWGIAFHVGNMATLTVADSSWGDIAAFYSIIHIPPSQIAAVLHEFWRVLQPWVSF